MLCASPPAAASSRRAGVRGSAQAASSRREGAGVVGGISKHNCIDLQLQMKLPGHILLIMPFKLAKDYVVYLL